MLKNLTPRSISALAVVAVTFFLTIVVAMNGGSVFANPKAAGWDAQLSGWLVEYAGAGIWVLLLLPMIWAAIVYFEERTPDLTLRLAGTALLAVSVSTIASLSTHGGLWGGHVGNGVAHALGGLTSLLGAFGTLLAWLITLAVAGVSAIFATEWLFHSLRRSGRFETETRAAIVAEPARRELLIGATSAEPREFVVESPRAAAIAAEMQDVVENSSAEAATPSGWDEIEDEGRTVIAAPTGYRGVEFLPTSDELALPEVKRVLAVEPIPDLEQTEVPGFRDDVLVATPEAAFFAPTADDEASDWDVDLEDVEAEQTADDEVVADAVETLFAAVTEPPAAPVSGIGLPEDSPFHDEVFSTGGWPYANEAEASPLVAGPAASEPAARFVAPPAPEPVAEAAAAEDVETPQFEDEQLFVDDAIVSRIPASAFDDLMPQTPAEPEPEVAQVEEPQPFLAPAMEPEAVVEFVVPAVEIEEPIVVSAEVTPREPQLPLFAEPATVAMAPAMETSSSAVATLPEVNLALLHSMELDPLFRDAVNAVLERGRASAVVLQRQLGIGYARGIRILDQMTTSGLTGPDTPTGTRELRLTKESWAAFTA